MVTNPKRKKPAKIIYIDAQWREIPTARIVPDEIPEIVTEEQVDIERLYILIDDLAVVIDDLKRRVSRQERRAIRWQRP